MRGAVRTSSGIAFHRHLARRTSASVDRWELRLVTAAPGTGKRGAADQTPRGDGDLSALRAGSSQALLRRPGRVRAGVVLDHRLQRQTGLGRHPQLGEAVAAPQKRDGRLRALGVLLDDLLVLVERGPALVLRLVGLPQS